MATKEDTRYLTNEQKDILQKAIKAGANLVGPTCLNMRVFEEEAKERYAVNKAAAEKAKLEGCVAPVVLSEDEGTGLNVTNPHSKTSTTTLRTDFKDQNQSLKL